MEEEFVIYPLALRMKALGYDGPCFGYYVDGELRGVNLGIEQLGGIKPYYQRFGFHALSNHDIENPKKIVVTAPTWQQAFKWFRKEHGLSGWVDESFGGGLRRGVISIKSEIGSKYYPTTTKLFYTYEEAELDCLEKLIEIVENNK